MQQLYDNNRHAIVGRIQEQYPNLKAVESDSDHLANALWMLEKIPRFTDQGKIDRWMGCVQGTVHTVGLFTWRELRDLTRQDLETGPIELSYEEGRAEFRR